MSCRISPVLLVLALSGFPASRAAAQVAATGPERLPLQAPAPPVIGSPGSALPVPADPAVVRPTRRINRNPAHRDDLPPAPAPRETDRATIPPQTTDSSRATLVPNPAPCDPRNSSTRPVRIPESDNPAASPCAP